MGEVYLARDARLERNVAIKVLPAEFTTSTDRVRRFEREAKAASALNHPISLLSMKSAKQPAHTTLLLSTSKAKRFVNTTQEKG